MKKKILVTIPIILIAMIIIVVIPKHNNIEATPQDEAETSEVSEPTTEPEVIEPEKEKTLRQEKGITQFNAKQGLVEGHEVQETAEPEQATVEDGINSTHTDVILGDGEYKGDSGVDALQSEYDSLSEEDQAAVNRIEENLKKKHPEWFADTPSTGTGEGNYEHVGTPDNGELPPSTFGQGDYSGLEGGQVY